MIMIDAIGRKRDICPTCAEFLATDMAPDQEWPGYVRLPEARRTQPGQKVCDLCDQPFYEQRLTNVLRWTDPEVYM